MKSTTMELTLEDMELVNGGYVFQFPGDDKYTEVIDDYSGEVLAKFDNPYDAYDYCTKHHLWHRMLTWEQLTYLRRYHELPY